MIRSLLKTIRDRTPAGSVAARILRAGRQVGLPVPHRLDRHLPFRGVVNATAGRDFTGTAPVRFRMQSHGHVIENELFWVGLNTRERTSHQVWMRLASAGTAGFHASVPGPLVLDVGANTGLFSLTAAAAAPGSQVVAFEPLSRIAKLCRQNVALNPEATIDVVEAAVGDEVGEVTIHDPGGSQPSSASLVSGFIDGPTQPVRVPVVTVDRVVSERMTNGVSPEVALVKVDVEGFEAAVFRGMGQTIATHRPSIVAEVLDRDSEVLREIAKIEAQDYRTFDLAADGPIEMTGRFEVPRDRNLLLIPTERVAAIADLLPNETTTT